MTIFFDTVYTVNTIYFWEDTAKVLDEVRRVLKDGGNFICTFYTKGYLDKLPYCDTGFDKFTPQQVRSMARERGFHDVKSQNSERLQSVLPCWHENRGRVRWQM